MRRAASFALTMLSVSAAALCAVAPAEAACRKMGFLVNDYGKDGPTKDAQELLEKDIAKWAAGQGITNYTVGKKDVSCELFLNFIVFDEHTCTASATVCWDEKAPTKPAQDAKAVTGKPPAAAAEAAKPAAEKVEKAAVKNPADATLPAKENNPLAEPADKVKNKTEGIQAETPAPPAAKIEPVKAAEPTAPDVKKDAAAASKVETGAVPAKPAAGDNVKIPADAVTAVTGHSPAATPEKDPSQAAAAAAERAAAAAERAAIAAERAAQAAQDAQQANNASAPAAAAPAIVQPFVEKPAPQQP